MKHVIRVVPLPASATALVDFLIHPESQGQVSVKILTYPEILPRPIPLGTTSL